MFVLKHHPWVPLNKQSPSWHQEKKEKKWQPELFRAD